MGPPLYGFTAEITVSNRTCVMDQTREDACFIDDGRENDFDLHSYFHRGNHIFHRFPRSTTKQE